jgi:hypothetical protein
MELPPAVLDLMWEYDLSSLGRSTEPPDAVIGRVMERGSLEAMRWLLEAVGRDRLSAFLARRGARSLPPRELRFWCWTVGIPEPRATEWVRQAQGREAAWRG